MTLIDALRYWPFLLTLGGAFASLVIWLAKMETRVKSLDGVAAKVQELGTKMTLIWDIYISDALKRQTTTGNVSHSSALKLTPEFYERYGSTIVPEISVALRRMGRETLPQSDGELAVLIAKRLGDGVSASRAAAFDMAVGDYLAIVVAWVRESEAYHKQKGMG